MASAASASAAAAAAHQARAAEFRRLTKAQLIDRLIKAEDELWDLGTKSRGVELLGEFLSDNDEGSFVTLCRTIKYEALARVCHPPLAPNYTCAITGTLASEQVERLFGCTAGGYARKVHLANEALRLRLDAVARVGVVQDMLTISGKQALAVACKHMFQPWNAEALLVADNVAMRRCIEALKTREEQCYAEWQLALKTHKEQWQLALKTSDDRWQLALKTSDDRWQLALKRRDATSLEKISSTVAASFSHLSLAVKKVQAKRASSSEADPPEEQ